MPVDMAGLILYGAAMIGTPGPANMVVMASGARFGFRRTLPFLAGVILGKQAIIWPLGLGLVALLEPGSLALRALQVLSIAYILYLAWRIAGTRIVAREAGEIPPGFAAGLIVHPLNPKAWALMLGGLANFTETGASALVVTAIMAAVFLVLQIIAQSFWTGFGDQVARLLAGTDQEIWLMRGLALAMLASIAWAIT